jgi:hypothetical protein
MYQVYYRISGEVERLHGTYPAEGPAYRARDRLWDRAGTGQVRVAGGDPAVECSWFGAAGGGGILIAANRDGVAVA